MSSCRQAQGGVGSWAVAPPWVGALVAEAGPRIGTSMEQLRAVSEHWGSDAAAPLRWILVAVGALLIALGTVLLVRWWRGRHLRSQPWQIFRQVAAVAELGLRDQWLLVRIARHQKLPTPLTLLLSGRTLRVHGREYAEALAPWRRAAIMQRIATIRRHLFGNMDGEQATT